MKTCTLESILLTMKFKSSVSKGSSPFCNARQPTYILRRFKLPSEHTSLKASMQLATLTRWHYVNEKTREAIFHVKLGKPNYTNTFLDYTDET